MFTCTHLFFNALHLSLTHENHSSGTLTADVLNGGCFLNIRACLTNGAYRQGTFNKNKEKTNIYLLNCFFFFNIQHDCVLPTFSLPFFCVIWALGSLKDQTVVSCRWQRLHVNRNPVLKPIGLQMKVQLSLSRKLKADETQSQFSAPRSPRGCSFF